MVREQIRARLRVWLKENLFYMKSLVEGMRYVGGEEELVRQYKWYAEDCVRLKNLIKLMK